VPPELPLRLPGRDAKAGGMKVSLLLASLGLLACASAESPGDSGIDASVDAGMDSGLDSGLDSGTDSGLDSGIDSGIDASVLERRIFVTSSVQNADFGGLAEAVSELLDRADLLLEPIVGTASTSTLKRPS